MTFNRFTLFILGFAAATVPTQASLSFNNGDQSGGTLNGAIANWNTASGLNYTSSEIFFTGAVSGTPATYTDPSTSLFFEGFNPSGTQGNVVNGTQNSLSISGTSLKQPTTAGIIEITGFGSGVQAFAFEYQPTFSGSNGFCIGVNRASFNEGSFCDDSTGVQSSGDVGFVGITSTTPITSVWIGPSFDQSQTFQINNFDGPGGAVGERSTLLLLGFGLILLGFLGRFRRAEARS
ncbi:MAG TPA: hypothetical protein VKX39_03170 [Bryobacteraceae bacterium]|jgi:hypothetical protein|nr:hypothetical protein [Bryobacteraceae bacterium]